MEFPIFLQYYTSVARVQLLLLFHKFKAMQDNSRLVMMVLVIL